jgi:hypothetical protein
MTTRPWLARAWAVALALALFAAVATPSLAAEDQPPALLDTAVQALRGQVIASNDGLLLLRVDGSHLAIVRPPSDMALPPVGARIEVEGEPSAALVLNATALRVLTS